MRDGCVSIIIPMYNAETFLHETIESCLKQSYKNVQIILIDDCSNDRTFEIAKDYCRRYPKIKLLRNNFNLGLIKTLNIAIDVVEGEFTLVLGNDDILNEIHLEKMVTALKSNEKNVFAYCESILIDEKGQELGLSNTIDLNEKPYKIACINPINSCGLLMRTQNLLLANKYPVIEGCPNYGEWLLWIKLLANGRAVYVRDIKSFYRIHSKNLSKSFMNEDKIKNNYHYNLLCMHTAQKELSLKIYEKIYVLCKEIIYRMKMVYHIYVER